MGDKVGDENAPRFGGYWLKPVFEKCVGIFRGLSAKSVRLSRRPRARPALSGHSVSQAVRRLCPSSSRPSLVHNRTGRTKTPRHALGGIRAARCPSSSAGGSVAALWLGWRSLGGGKVRRRGRGAGCASAHSRPPPTTGVWNKKLSASPARLEHGDCLFTHGRLKYPRTSTDTPTPAGYGPKSPCRPC